MSTFLQIFQLTLGQKNAKSPWWQHSWTSVFHYLDPSLPLLKSRHKKLRARVLVNLFSMYDLSRAGMGPGLKLTLHFRVHNMTTLKYSSSLYNSKFLPCLQYTYWRCWPRILESGNQVKIWVFCYCWIMQTLCLSSNKLAKRLYNTRLLAVSIVLILKEACYIFWAILKISSINLGMVYAHLW